MKTKVVIVYPYPVFGNGIRELISRLDFLQIAGETDNERLGDGILSIVGPQVAVLDAEVFSSQLILKETIAKHPNTKFILITQVDSEKTNLLRHSNLLGFVSKYGSSHDLEYLLRKSAGVESDAKPAVPFYSFEEEAPSPDNATTVLSPSEKKVIKMISEGNTSREIAAQLFISVNTVENHRANIIKKLRLEGKNSLLIYAMKNKEQINA